jgi:cold shock CspA family protein
MALVRYGTITRIMNAKGYLFVTEDVTKLSVFCHAKELCVKDLDVVFVVGQPVEFTCVETDKGLRGTSVRVR